MPNYQKGKIYRIVDNSNGGVYYGSTCEPTIARRLARHVIDFNNFQKGKGSYITSYDILVNGNYEIFLVETYPCTSRDELTSRERYYIENNNCVNKYIPGRTCKEYRRDNKEKIKENKRSYQQHNKERIKEYMNLYQLQNKDKIKKQTKDYKQKNKDRIHEHQNFQSKCICGGCFTNANKAKHLKTRKHQTYFNNLDKNEYKYYYEDGSECTELEYNLYCC